MAERMIEANDAELCSEAFGNPGDPPILLVMGMSASMVWWAEEFCERLADERRFVIRYDHRDTGRSVTYPPGYPAYTASDLVRDAIGVLDAYGLAAAHIVGVSMGGALAQLLALDFPDRVLSLVLIRTCSAVPEDRDLPLVRTGSDGSWPRCRLIGQIQPRLLITLSTTGVCCGARRVLSMRRTSAGLRSMTLRVHVTLPPLRTTDSYRTKIARGNHCRRLPHRRS